MKSSLHSLLSDFESVFDPTIQGYNGAAGPFEAKPPQRKGHLPEYAQSKLVDLQKQVWWVREAVSKPIIPYQQE